MQEDPDVEISLTHASSNHMGSHITSNCCVQRPCNAKLYALRTGRHGGQREQRLSRPSRSPLKKNMEIRSQRVAYLVISKRDLHDVVLQVHIYPYSSRILRTQYMYWSSYRAPAATLARLLPGSQQVQRFPMRMHDCCTDGTMHGYMYIYACIRDVHTCMQEAPTVLDRI